MKRRAGIRWSVLLAGALGLLLAAGSAGAGYLPLWVKQERFDYTIEARNEGLRTFSAGDTQLVRTYAVTLLEVFHVREGAAPIEIAPGESLLVLARGNFLQEDRSRYLLFLFPERRRGYTGLPLPLFEGEAVPCDRTAPMFTHGPVRCAASRAPEADSCACARETIVKHAELLAAREEGRDLDYLRGALAEENAITVLSAMGVLRQRGLPGAMEAMAFLVGHEEIQVRYDLAESIPYIGGEAAGQVGIRLLDDPQEHVQLLAAYGLGRMGYEAAAPRLAEILADPAREKLVRASCLSALDKMESPALVPALERAIANGPEEDVAGFRIHLEKKRAAETRRR